MRRIQHLAKSVQEEEEAGTSDLFSSNYVAILFPYFLHWSRVYGSIYLYSTGRIQALNVTDPNMLKELANCKSLDLGKPCYLQKERGALLGTGILTSNGDLWVHQRKVIAPELFMGKVKAIIQGSKDGPITSCTREDFIVDNCKNIYFAGHETASTTAAWCLMLLASHHEWQSRARLTMVIQETLRVYPPASFVVREALDDIKLGGMTYREELTSGSQSQWLTGILLYGS
ncbi:hypothetical protein E2562_025175 [Oryza meyeriana var. granulata]|uniref:Cytochrome P450 n=1 Tax=Oryza meyeriana var. granulata TaxID=110450 RepID=A0A6G1E3S3_9ORYZ|nr:hypothetical protein E2562_025175 [Oryza meyeriana var. granulata]